MSDDFKKRLSDEEFERLRPAAIEFIKTHIKKNPNWRRCYGLKKQMVKQIGYCYQADMYEFLKECGFEVTITEQGDHLAKADY